MKFYVWACFFDQYVYLLYKKEDGFLTAIGDKLRNGKWCTFIYCGRDFIYVCYSCLISLTQVRKYNVDSVIDSLRKICHCYLGDSYIWTVVKLLSAKTCFESALSYLKMEEYSSNAESELIDMFRVRCLKHIVVCYNLFLDLYVLKMTSYIKILITVILVEIFSDGENCVLFCAFCFRFCLVIVWVILYTY